MNNNKNKELEGILVGYNSCMDCPSKDAGPVPYSWYKHVSQLKESEVRTLSLTHLTRDSKF